MYTCMATLMKGLPVYQKKAGCVRLPKLVVSKELTSLSKGSMTGSDTFVTDYNIIVCEYLDTVHTCRL